MKSGQILILVLLIVVVILAVGLSVASRNITNLRTSTQTEHSQRAFTAAEGGVEDVLSRLQDITQSNPQVLTEAGANIPVVVGDISADVNVKASKVFERPVSLGNVAQISLEGYTGSQVQIEWAKNDPLENNQIDGSASLEIIQLNGTSPVTQTRWYFQGTAGSAPRNENIGLNLEPSTICTSASLLHCRKVDIFASPNILRVKPFWNNTTLRVSGVDGNELPVQTYELSSSASTEIGATRKVEVSRSALPQLPAIFDYVLYSESDIVK